MKKINWNELAELGLLERINREVLHPLGLAAYRDENGNSGGALVSDDGEFCFDSNMESRVISDEEVKERLSKL